MCYVWARIFLTVPLISGCATCSLLRSNIAFTPFSLSSCSSVGLTCKPCPTCPRTQGPVSSSRLCGPHFLKLSSDLTCLCVALIALLLVGPLQQREVGPCLASHVSTSARVCPVDWLQREQPFLLHLFQLLVRGSASLLMRLKPPWVAWSFPEDRHGDFHSLKCDL